jgi:hypothetical protein
MMTAKATPMTLRLTVAFCAASSIVGSAGAARAQTLEGFATLPADTFASGPTSGNVIAPANGRVPPFDGQPVQGISSVLPGRDGEFWVMPDNGFGTKETSPDFLLRIYRIEPHFRTKHAGSGTIDVKSSITLRDPDYRIAFPIVADGAFYPGSSIGSIRTSRSADSSPVAISTSNRCESRVTTPCGSETSSGRFFSTPTSTADCSTRRIPCRGQIAQNPFLALGAPNLPRSKGFEGMGISCSGKTLYPLLEGPLTTDPDQSRLIINEFNAVKRKYTGHQWFYRLERETATGQSIGDLTQVTSRDFLVIERDNFEGPLATFKKIYLINLDDVDADGFLIKHEVADLLNIRDPRNLAGFGPIFRFPFQTIESVIVLDREHLGVLNDNNYPFSAGRVAGQPDPNEFIIIKLDRPLPNHGCDDERGDLRIRHGSW